MRILRAFLVTTIFLGSVMGTEAASTKPNIILIFADDIGVETVGAYGSEYATPRLDSMAAQGVRFNNAHSTPICTPSRVRLLSGRHSFRNYRDFEDFDPKETAIGELLKAQGYNTLVAGKWQLAGKDGESGSMPEDAGFDESLVWNMSSKTKGNRFWEPKLYDNGVLKTSAEADFGPDIVNRRVLNFIESNQSEPFFIYYPMILAHNPWVTTPDSLAAKSKKQKFAGMMGYLDKMVGNVLDKIDQRGLSENTLVLFMGDNGTNTQITTLRYGKPVTGDKGGNSNAATHVPFLMQWKGRFPQGKVLDSLVEVMDIFPSIVDAANVDMPANVDGISMLPYIRGEAESVRESIYIHYDPRPTKPMFKKRAQFAYNAEWKLFRDGRFYNTFKDPLQKYPLATTTKRLREESALEAYAALKKVLDNIDTPKT